MKKNIAIIVPHKGLGDMLFHYKFINSLHNHHKCKLTLITNPSSKADLIFQNNHKIKKVILLDLRRPNIINYISRVYKLIRILFKYNFNIIYYTGFNKWQRLAFFIVKLYKKTSIRFYKNNKSYILSFLNYFLKKEKIKIHNDLNYDLVIKVRQNFINKIRVYKKPWVFLSIDTSEDQIKIPKETLNLIINNLKTKYKTIFINTNSFNQKKLKNIKNKSIIKTNNFNILEVSYLIKNSQLFIGTESGPAIIAAIYKKKSIIFFSKQIKKESLLMENSNLRFYFLIENINKNIKKLFNIIKN